MDAYQKIAAPLHDYGSYIVSCESKDCIVRSDKGILRPEGENWNRFGGKDDYQDGFE